MSWLGFGEKKPTPKEAVRQQKRELGKSERVLDREYRDIERTEKKLEAEIKAAAKKGDRTTAAALAKNLVQMRKQKERLLISKSQIKGIGMQATAMGSQAVVAGAMKTSAGAMANMNKQLDVVGMQQTMRQYERQQAKMELTQEMMDDTLDAMFGDEDSDVDDVVNSVLDELGLEMTEEMGKVAGPGQSSLEAPAQAESVPGADDELAERLAKLTAMS